MGVCTTDTNIRKGGNPKNGNCKNKIIMDPKNRRTYKRTFKYDREY